MRVLGIDCGLSTGWAIVEDGKVVESGVEDFRPKRGSSNGVLFLEYRRWLSQMVQPKRPGEKRHHDLIVYELSHMRGGAATELQINMTGRVQEIAAGMNTEFVAVHSGTLKKETIGKGNASKDEMKKWSEQFLGRAPEDDNEADAVALATYGCNKYEVESAGVDPDPMPDETEGPTEPLEDGGADGADGMGPDTLTDFV